MVFDDGLAQALVSAGTARAAGRGAAAWQELDRVVRGEAEADPVLAALWSRIAAAGGGDPADVRRLVDALVTHAVDGSPLRERLVTWTRRYPAPGSDGAALANTLGGDAQVWGPVVQARDIAGGIHVHQAAAPDRDHVVPRQLLPTPAYFTDRTDALRALTALRGARDRSATQVIVVSGAAGMGKTTLASRWLSGREEEFPDGQLYVDLRGDGSDAPPNPGEVLGYLLRAFGRPVEPAALAEQAALWRSVTAGLRFALMLDNALSAAQIRLLLPSAPGSLVVATSRSRLTGLAVDGAVFLRLGVLDEHAAEELFARTVGRARVDRERSAVREVVSLCAGLPLAVCLAAARLASRPEQPVASMAAALGRGAGPLGALRAEGARTLQAVLDECYGALTSEVARVYRHLGLLPAALFEAALVAAACAVGDTEAERLLDVLVEVNLLEVTGADRYRFHDLVRLHAAQRGEAEETMPARDEALRRHVDWCLATATSAEEVLTPSHRTLDRGYVFRPPVVAVFADESAALAWLETHREALMAAVRRAAQAGWDSTTWQLVDAMWPMFLRLRLYDSWIEAHEIGLGAARRGRDGAGEARMLTSGGIGLRSAGRYDEAVAWFSQALELARLAGDLRDEAQALNGLGSSHRGAGRPAEAEECFSGALVLRERIGYRRGAALSRLRLGELALDQGGFEKAVGHLTRAHEDLVAEHDGYDATRARSLLGFALARRGSPDAGLRELHLALGEFEAAGSAFWRARTLEMIGRIAHQEGEVAAARGFYERSLRIYTSISTVDTRRAQERLRDLDSGDAPS
jgi:tetratricopeptide (TPR) repeat protein